MAGVTTRGYPYPEDIDRVDIAADTRALAEAIDTDVTTIDLRVDELEAFRVELVTTLQAVLDPENPTTAAALAALLPGAP